MRELSIEYCGVCNYRPIAARLSREVEKEIGMKLMYAEEEKSAL